MRWQRASTHVVPVFMEDVKITSSLRASKGEWMAIIESTSWWRDQNPSNLVKIKNFPEHLSRKPIKHGLRDNWICSDNDTKLTQDTVLWVAWALLVFCTFWLLFSAVFVILIVSLYTRKGEKIRSHPLPRWLFSSSIILQYASIYKKTRG
jgi:hypothetical protein